MYDAVTDHAGLAGNSGPFAFKFVPQLDQKFGKEVDVKDLKTEGGWRPLEWFFFGCFVVACFFACAVALGGWNLAVYLGVGDVPALISDALSF